MTPVNAITILASFWPAILVATIARTIWERGRRRRQQEIDRL